MTRRLEGDQVAVRFLRDMPATTLELEDGRTARLYSDDVARSVHVLIFASNRRVHHAFTLATGDAQRVAAALVVSASKGAS